MQQKRGYMDYFRNRNRTDVMDLKGMFDQDVHVSPDQSELTLTVVDLDADPQSDGTYLSTEYSASVNGASSVFRRDGKVLFQRSDLRTAPDLVKGELMELAVNAGHS